MLFIIVTCQETEVECKLKAKVTIEAHHIFRGKKESGGGGVDELNAPMGAEKKGNISFPRFIMSVQKWKVWIFLKNVQNKQNKNSGLRYFLILGS